MIKSGKKLEEFERELLRSRKSDYWENLRVFEALYREAVSLGILPLKNPLEDLETDIRVAQVINGVREPS